MLAPLNHINAVDRYTTPLPCYGEDDTRCICCGNRFNLMSRERLITLRYVIRSFLDHLSFRDGCARYHCPAMESYVKWCGVIVRAR